MLDSKGGLKITDFGEAEVFQSPYESAPHKSKRCCGSQPYMAPEEFTEKEFDPRPIDIFACGIIYLAMIYNRLPWRKPHIDDPHYRFYLEHLDHGFTMIERLPHGPRELLRHVLEPVPANRASMKDILENAWFKSMEQESEARKAGPPTFATSQTTLVTSA
jgi:protein-serine/threonine kinase